MAHAVGMGSRRTACVHYRVNENYERRWHASRSMAQPNVATASSDDLVVMLPRVFLATLVANLPMLALLLVPQLMRSRAGSETLLLAGTTLYLSLVAIALTIAPRVSAWAAPRSDKWVPSTVSRTIRELRQKRVRDFWQRVGEWFLLFLVAQAVGFFVAWLMPYVSDNPQFGSLGEARWIVHYRNYVVHAVAIYLFSCFSFAWLGVRLRQLALR